MWDLEVAGKNVGWLPTPIQLHAATGADPKIKKRSEAFLACFCSSGWHLVCGRVLGCVPTASAPCKRIFLMVGGEDTSKMLFLNKAWQGIRDKVQCRI